MKKRVYLFGIVLFGSLLLSIPEIIHQNDGLSTSVGSVREGKLKNAWLMPYADRNYRYFSFSSYYIANNAYMHSDVFEILSAAYMACESSCPDVQFRLMECNDRKGGKLLIHRTHQNGTSADFMVPKLRNGKQVTYWDCLGYLHYLLEFDSSGRLKVQKSTRIDFESMAKHILAVDDSAKKQGWKIHKVIFKIDLQDDLFASSSGAQLRRRNIYFVKQLSPMVDKVHDDHYHIDFRKA